MNKGTAATLVLGLLAFAAAWQLQRPRRETPAEGTPLPAPSAPSEDTGRFPAFQANLDALATVDASAVLYREAAPLDLPSLDALRAVAVGADGRLYAGGGTNILVLAPDGGVLRRVGVAGNVTCLAVDSAGRLYAGLGSSVQAFTPDGVRANVFEGLGTNSLATSIAATTDHVFVADAGSRVVARYTPSGVRERTFDGRATGSPEAGFRVPSPYFDLALGEGDVLWVANPGRHRLEEYDFDGVRIDAWEERSGPAIDAFCGCCNPAHIARREDGAIVTAEKGFRRIKVHSRRGQFLGVVAPPEVFEDHPWALDIAIAPDGRVLVADPARIQIRIFVMARKPD